MKEYYKDYILNLKKKPLKEIESQIAHRFQNRYLSSTDLYELNVDEYKRRALVKNNRLNLILSILTLLVALIAAVPTISYIINTILHYIYSNIKIWL
jgi:hypothetical protein